ncbi:MAG: hydrolase [Nitrosopumilus sp.]|nr:hydrolase [Nitrosopumilus sp.]MDH3515258.1 hydrolase [Nitrosopumilus sp.]MDH3564441.1 hydrolase [Nitrosopumilus sp.]MDH5417268.1 hydrolase [Nitrosopumilus sp.]MDH5554350.1 hydrolase [Nitrosopumilus sp.]
MSDNKDELIDAQKQIIGILFEVIKRLQANNDLDDEYFQIIANNEKNEIRLKEILDERTENAKIVGRLLEQLQI